MGDITLHLNPQIPSIPSFEDKTKIDVRYVVISPYASIHIYWNSSLGELIYDVEEPILTEEDKSNLLRIQEAMREVVNINMVGVENTQEGILDYVDKTARLVISELGLSIDEGTYDKMYYYLYRNFIGLNEIEAIMKDYYI